MHIRSGGEDAGALGVSVRFRRAWLALSLVALATPAIAAEPSSRPDLTSIEIGEAPWSAIGRINNSAYGRCSAVLVRPKVALTAAHCLYNIASRRFLRPASIHVLFGFSKGQYGFHTTAADITIPKGYVPGEVMASAPHDWAVLHLAEAAPEDFAPMAIANGDDAAPRTVRAAGFGQERSEVLTATASCAVKSPPGSELLVTDCHLSHGFSGGPMIDADTGRLVGISTMASEKSNRTFGIAIPVSRIVSALPGL